MKSLMTKAEAAVFKTQWSAVNAAEVEELRATSVKQKARQLAALMASVEQLGWAKTLASEESEVRNRWNRLRRAYRA